MVDACCTMLNLDYEQRTGVCMFCRNFHVFHLHDNKLLVHATRNIIWFSNLNSISLTVEVRFWAWKEGTKTSTFCEKTDNVHALTKFQQNEHTPGINTLHYYNEQSQRTYFWTIGRNKPDRKPTVARRVISLWLIRWIYLVTDSSPMPLLNTSGCISI